MYKEFIPYKEALALKKLGFDEPCFAYYDEEDNSQTIYEYANCNGNVTGDKACYNYDFLSVTNSQLDEYGAFGAKDDEGEECFLRWTASTFSQAFRFFREKYKLHSTITSISQESWQWHITKPGEPLGKLYEEDFYNYEEAELACLQHLIKIVNENNYGRIN